jgi:hypothetical protein
MKLETLVNSKDALTSLTKQNLPMELAWKIKKFITKANIEIMAFEEIKREKIISFGEPVMDGDKKTDKMKVKNENLKIYLEEMQDILNKEIEIDIPEIKIEDILEYNKRLSNPAEISVTEFMVLDWLIK